MDLGQTGPGFLTAFIQSVDLALGVSPEGQGLPIIGNIILHLFGQILHIAGPGQTSSDVNEFELEPSFFHMVESVHGQNQHGKLGRKV